MEEQLLELVLNALGPIGLVIASALGGLVVIGQAVVTITPSTADDAAWEKLMSIPILGGILKAIASFAPIQKKPK